MYGSRRGMDRVDAKPTLGYAGHAPNKIPSVLADPSGTAAPKTETRLCAPSTVAALELEHALGFAPCLNALAYCPATVGGGAASASHRGGFDDPSAPGPSATSVLYACGRLVIIHDLDETHEQRVLRSHDAPVTAVDASPAGTYLASGQRAAVDQRVYVNIWDAATLGVRHRLQTPHQGHAELVRFSSDEAMLATTGAEGGLCIWDCASGSLIASYRDTLNGDQARGLCWGEVRNPGARDQSYVLYAAFHTGVRVCTLTFSLKKLNFELDVRACVMPGAGGRMGGFTRRYTCCDVIGNDVLCGSTSGDVLIFQAGTGTYRNAVTVAAGGVSALLSCPEYNCVIVAGGDGGVRKMVQSPQSREWAVVKHITLPGGVVSMCRSIDEHQIIVSTTSGAMIRILASDLSFAVAAQAPLGAVTDLAVADDAPEIFATASTDGVVRIWDLSTYTVRSTAVATSGGPQQQQGSNPAQAFRTSTAGGAGGNINNAMQAAPDGAANAIVPTSIAFVPGTGGAFAVAGWSDGRIRGIDFRHGAAGVVQWSAPAHKGRVNSVQVTAQYILTSGSEDSAVRIWTLTTRELAGQMQDHKAPVAAAMTDVTTDIIVHSCGADGVMCSYDISKTNPNPSVKSCQRVAMHSYSAGGPFTCIAQRRDHEREMIVGTHEGRVAFFDMDVAEPVLVIEDKKRARVTCVSVSPTGQYLVVGSADGTLSLYELFSQDGGVCAPILQCACHSTGIARAQWASDGRQVITGGTDGEVLVWNFFTMPKASY